MGKKGIFTSFKNLFFWFVLSIKQVSFYLVFFMQHTTIKEHCGNLIESLKLMY